MLFKIFISLMMFLVVPVSAVSESAPKEFATNILDIRRYADLVVVKGFSIVTIKDASISFVNSPFKEDKSALMSFSDAYLWTTGVRTNIRNGYSGNMRIVYVSNFVTQENLGFDDEILRNIYSSQFSIIREGGPCTKMVLTDTILKEKLSYVFLDRNSNFDERATCIYRHYRALFGLNEKFQMPTFGETFVSDLRLLNCKYKNPDTPDIISLLDSGRC